MRKPDPGPTTLWTLECAVRKAKGRCDADRLAVSLSRMEEAGRIEPVQV